MKNKEKEYILGLDISTTTIGVSLFEDIGNKKGKLVILEHISPKIKKKDLNSIEKIFIKSDLFYDAFMDKYLPFNITKIIIEEPLLRSNNVNTVATLLRFNGILSKMLYDKFGLIPEYISSYDSRKFAFPELMGKKDVDSKGKKLTAAAFEKKKETLFGAFPKDIDKKKIIWGLVNELEPNIDWMYSKKGELIKECYDMTDSFCCVLGYMRKENLWDTIVKNNEMEE